VSDPAPPLAGRQGEGAVDHQNCFSCAIYPQFSISQSRFGVVEPRDELDFVSIAERKTAGNSSDQFAIRHVISGRHRPCDRRAHHDSRPAKRHGRDDGTGMTKRFARTASSAIATKPKRLPDKVWTPGH